MGNLKERGVFIVLVILFFLSLNIVYAAVCDVPTNGDHWNITEECSKSDEVIYISNNTNINISNGGKLNLDNVTLIVNGTSDGNSNITVYSGGEFNATDGSNISSGNPGTFEYSLIVNDGATFGLESSSVEHIGYGTSQGQRGLEINGTISKFEGSSVWASFYALSLYSSDNVIYNNTFNMTSGTGARMSLYMENAAGNNISSNIFATASGGTLGSDVFNIDNSTLEYNYFWMDKGFAGTGNYALKIAASENVTVIDNNITTPDDSQCFLLRDCSNINLTSNVVDGGTAISLAAFELAGSNHSYFDNNNFSTTVSGDSLYTSLSENNTFEYNNFSGAVKGVFLQGLQNHTFTGDVFEGGSNNGARFVNTDNLLFIDSAFVSGNNADIYTDSGAAGPSNATFLNCTYDDDEVILGKDGTVFEFKWSLEVYVNDSSGSAISGANVTGANNSETEVFSKSTGSDGFIITQNLTEVVKTFSVNQSYNNYTINVTKTNYDDYSTSINLTGSNQLNITPTYNDGIAPANITFVSETLDNNSQTLDDFVYVNLTFDEDNTDSCLLEFNNNTLTNHTMTVDGTSCYYNLTDVSNGNWNYTVYVNDTYGNLNNSDQRDVQVQALPNLFSKDVMGRVSNVSITIHLVNGVKNASFYAEYGTSSTSLDNYDSNSSIVTVENNSIVEINLTGLTADTIYYYRVRGNDSDDLLYGATNERSFRTRRDSYPFNFTIFTDSHVGPTTLAAQGNLTYLLINMSELDGSDFAMFLGDNMATGPDGIDGIENETYAEDSYQIFRNITGAEYCSVPIFSLVGNWEGEPGWETAENLTTARNLRKKYIPNPDNDTYLYNGSVHQDYYAFDWGNALFVVLNVMSYTETNPLSDSEENWTLGATQLDWFNHTVINSNKSWKLVFIHHAVGGNWSGTASDAWNTKYGRGGGRAAYVGEQNSVHQIMQDNDVRVLFYGHDHVFTDIVVDKIHYVMAGRTQGINGFAAGHPGYSINEIGRTKVSVLSDERLNISYIVNESGSLEANLIVDRVAPRINLVSPSDNSADGDGNVTIIFNISDESSIENCTLFLNDELNQTNATMLKDHSTNFTLGNLSVGNYSWFINCTDYNYNTDGAINYTYHDGTYYVPNMNESDIRNFTIISGSEFSGNTTDLNLVNISNITNLVIDQPDYGMINFSETVDLTNTTDLDTYIDISNNSIYLNATALPPLNAPARLTLRGLAYTNPRVLKDGAVCSDCTEVSYSGGIFIFDVTSFSTYIAQETPAASSTTGGGDSGGGAGSGAIIGDSYSLDINDRIRFVYPGSQFYLDVEDITDEYVDLMFNEERVRILLNEKKDFDFDFDGNYDVVLTLVGVSDGKAEIRIRKYNQDLYVRIARDVDLIEDEEVEEEIPILEAPKEFFIGFFSKNLLLSGTFSSIVVLLLLLYFINKKFKKIY